MNIRLLVVLVLCAIISNCKNKPKALQHNEEEVISNENVVNFESDSCKIRIKEVERSDFTSFTNSSYSEPFFGMKADCISLKELVGKVTGIKEDLIVFNKRDIENLYYNVYVHQNVISKRQDSIIRRNIINALGLNIKKKIFDIDSTFISVNENAKSLPHVNTTMGDTIRSQMVSTYDSVKFENVELESILAYLNNEFHKTLVADSNESQRMNIELKKGDWNSTKAKLESDFGLVFRNVTTQQEKYIVDIKSY